MSSSDDDRTIEQLKANKKRARNLNRAENRNSDDSEDGSEIADVGDVELDSPAKSSDTAFERLRDSNHLEAKEPFLPDKKSAITLVPVVKLMKFPEKNIPSASNSVICISSDEDEEPLKPRRSVKKESSPATSSSEPEEPIKTNSVTRRTISISSNESDHVPLNRLNGRKVKSFAVKSVAVQKVERNSSKRRRSVSASSTENSNSESESEIENAKAKGSNQRSSTKKRAQSVSSVIQSPTPLVSIPEGSEHYYKVKLRLKRLPNDMTTILKRHNLNKIVDHRGKMLASRRPQSKVIHI